MIIPTNISDLTRDIKRTSCRLGQRAAKCSKEVHITEAERRREPKQWSYVILVDARLCYPDESKNLPAFKRTPYKQPKDPSYHQFLLWGCKKKGKVIPVAGRGGP
jgi:hypothetical protein